MPLKIGLPALLHNRQSYQFLRKIIPCHACLKRQNHFNRDFKRMTGVSPSEYRQPEQTQHKPPVQN